MIKFNEVTWYSKLLAIIFFIGAMPVLTFYIGSRYEQVKDQAMQAPAASSITTTTEHVKIQPRESDSAASADISNWKTYSNSEYGFSFSVPLTLEIIADATGFIPGFVALDGHSLRPSDSGQGDSIDFGIGKASECSVIDNAIGPNGIHLYTGQNETFNGIVFHKATLTEGYAGGVSTNTAYYTVHNNYCYTFDVLSHGYSQISGEKNLDSIIVNILNTIKFKQ